MKEYLKGILCGIGGVIPGLSGSVLLVIFGLYEKTIAAIGTLFKDFKRNILFLIPLLLGFATGIVAFSKVIDLALENFEVVTRFIFFGLILGTLPTFLKEVKKYGFKKRYYINTLIAILVGIFLFYVNADLFPKIARPDLISSFMIGCIVALASIVPGLDSASTLSALGLYEAYVKALASLDFSVLIPAAIGLGLSALVLSYLMHKLLEKHYTATFATIFGLFLCMAPKVLTAQCLAVLSFDVSLVGYLLCIVIGFIVSTYFGDMEKYNKRLFKRDR